MAGEPSLKITAPAQAEDGSQDERVKRVFDMATETFGSVEKAMAWLKRPTSSLSQVSPFTTVVKSPDGEAQVVDLLNRINHGLSV